MRITLHRSSRKARSGDALLHWQPMETNANIVSLTTHSFLLLSATAAKV